MVPLPVKFKADLDSIFLELYIIMKQLLYFIVAIVIACACSMQGITQVKFGIPEYCFKTKSEVNYTNRIQNIKRIAGLTHNSSRKNHCTCKFKQKKIDQQKQETQARYQRQKQREIVAKKLLESRRQFQTYLKRQRELHTVFIPQKTALDQDISYYRDLKNLCQKYGVSTSIRYEKLLQILREMPTQSAIYKQQHYKLSVEVVQMLCNAGIDQIVYISCYGNQLQQAFHQECIDILERTVHIAPESSVFVYKQAIADCVEAAREYNQAGLVHHASSILDFCWTLLDYGSAIVEGAVEGLVSAVRDIVEHPVHTVLCAIAGQYVLAYQLSKIVCNLAEIGITYTVDPERGIQKWDDYFEPVNHIIDAIQKKEITVRDSLKGATALAVGLKAQSKLLGGLNKFYNATKTKALEWAQKNPLLTPQEYVTTSEGSLFKAVEHSLESIHKKPMQERCPASCMIEYEKLKALLKIEEFTSIIKVTKHGILRLIERGFTPQEVCEVMQQATFIRLQGDGSKAYIKQIGARFNVIILNELEEKVITALKNLDDKALQSLSKNYGWK